MKPTLVALALLLAAPLASAQTATPETPTAKQWASLGAVTRFAGTGLAAAYGQQDFFALGTDARFGAAYFSSTLYGNGFAAEFFADALAYTRDPDPDSGLALVAYGGLGPRFLIQSNIYDDADGGSTAAYLLNIGGVGGFETRLESFGVFLELDISVPTFGLIGSSLRVFPIGAFPAPKLTLGANYYF